MKELILSEASFSDLESIASLHAQSWRENYKGIVSDNYLNNSVDKDRLDTWSSRLSNPQKNQWVLTAKSNDELVGFICMYGKQHPHHGTIIDNLHVSSNKKGQGIGTLLLHRAAIWAEKNYSTAAIYLEVLTDNHKAIAFYKALGGTHIADAVWNAPCGTQVSEWLYQWSAPSQLLAATSSRT